MTKATMLVRGKARVRLVGVVLCAACVGCSGKASRDGQGGNSVAGSAGAQSGGADATGAADAQGGAAGESPAGDGSAASASAGAGGEAAASSAVAVGQCKQLTTTLCSRAVQCTTGTNEGNCESQLGLEFGCDWAAPADYSACEHDSQAPSCDAVFPSGDLTLPQACLPPITATPLSDAQTQCYALVDALCLHSIHCLGRIATNSYVQNCEDDVTTDLQQGIPCLLAQAVGAGYQQCIQGIASLPCNDASDAGDAGPSMATIPACAEALTFAP